MNQDAHVESLASENDPRGHIFVVADGMGAHAAGELASQLAVREVETQYRSKSPMTVEAALVAALKQANSVIHERGQRDSQLYNMGTTCCALAIVPEGAITAHVGDSRVYRCRGDVIQQLTFDHSLVWEMRAAGQLGRSDRDAMIPRNVITRCLGPHAEVEADIEGPFSIRKGDVFLLCSDGLTGRVADTEVGAIANMLPPETAVQFLVDLANLRGGSDNITVIIAEITGESLSAEGKVHESPTRPHSPDTHAAWWFGAGAGLLTILAGLTLGIIVIAALGVGLFSLSAVGAALQWLRQSEHTEAQNVAPYVSSDATISQGFLDGIVETCEMVLQSLSMDELEADICAAKKLFQEDKQACCQKLANTARHLVNAVRADLDDSADPDAG